MPDRAPQTFKNHRRLVPPFHFGVFGILVVNLVATVVAVIGQPGFARALPCAVAFALILGFFYARAFAIAVQDRVIRLEMRVRLTALAPELMARFDDFTGRQLVALRFAGDGELRSLAQQALEGKLTDSKAIKQQIQNWKPDYWRA